VLIGERPGLSATDSMGLYLTWAARRGSNDAMRNCISNIRPGGLGADAAATKALWLLVEARKLGATGVALKDEMPSHYRLT
jgi:ethanolamine ammonia-lyase small subunit